MLSPRNRILGTSGNVSEISEVPGSNLVRATGLTDGVFLVSHSFGLLVAVLPSFLSWSLNKLRVTHLEEGHSMFFETLKPTYEARHTES